MSGTKFPSGLRNVLFDLDGCLWFGGRLAPGAKKVVELLRARGYRVFFLTNGSGATAPDIGQKLQRLGIEALSHQVLAPLEVAHQHPLLASGAPALVVGKPLVAQALRAHGVEVVDDPALTRVVVVGNWGELSFSDLMPAMAALDQGAQLLALNLDRRVPTEAGMIPGTGAIVAALTCACQVPALTVGKPTRFYFEQALARFGVESSQTLMVGDSPETDIAGGKRVGMSTALVGTALVQTDEEKPDLRVGRLEELLDELPHLQEYAG